jgi:hypothetical protein
MAWAPDYLDVVELADFVRVDDSVDNVQMEFAITAASRAIDDHCNRQFGKVDTAEERQYTARPDYERGLWVVDIDDLAVTTSLALDIDSDAITDYTLEPVNAVAKGMVWTRLAVSDDSTVTPTGEANELAITAVWGWTAVPTAVKQATLLQASRFLSRRDSPYGIAGSPDNGSEMRLLSRVDPDVGVALRKYRRPRQVG